MKLLSSSENVTQGFFHFALSHSEENILCFNSSNQASLILLSILGNISFWEPVVTFLLSYMKYRQWENCWPSKFTLKVAGKTRREQHQLDKLYLIINFIKILSLESIMYPFSEIRTVLGNQILLNNCKLYTGVCTRLELFFHTSCAIVSLVTNI